MARKNERLNCKIKRFLKSSTNNLDFDVTYRRWTLLNAILENNDEWYNACTMTMRPGVNTAHRYETFEWCVKAGVIEQHPTENNLFCITNYGKEWMQRKIDNGQWNRSDWQEWHDDFYSK